MSYRIKFIRTGKTYPTEFPTQQNAISFMLVSIPAECSVIIEEIKEVR